MMFVTSKGARQCPGRAVLSRGHSAWRIGVGQLFRTVAGWEPGLCWLRSTSSMFVAGDGRQRAAAEVLGIPGLKAASDLAWELGPCAREGHKPNPSRRQSRSILSTMFAGGTLRGLPGAPVPLEVSSLAGDPSRVEMHLHKVPLDSRHVSGRRSTPCELLYCAGKSPTLGREEPRRKGSRYSQSKAPVYEGRFSIDGGCHLSTRHRRTRWTGENIFSGARTERWSTWSAETSSRHLLR